MVESTRLHARIHGLVQGVYFRDTTRQTARSLNLTGWVRNLPGGSVEVMAEGPKPALESLLDFLRVGPTHACVERVVSEWEAASGEFTGFHVH
ncbi:MAG: acylphosphatase [Chloroflexi bacterium]|nr:acylphosphatase [Chloroflexota bacterium]